MVKLAILFPSPLLAVTWNRVGDSVTVGVPEISPVYLLIKSPEGRAGEILYNHALSPVLVGTNVVILNPSTK